MAVKNDDHLRQLPRNTVKNEGVCARKGQEHPSSAIGHQALTGELTLRRHEAADMAAEIGCKVEPGVNRNTTILVVGDQDITRLSGHNKSKKHRRAEDLISKGQMIRIIKESDFKALFK